MNKSKPQTYSTATIRQGIGTSLTPNSPDICQIVGTTDISISSPEKLQFTKSPTGSIKSLKDSANSDKKAKSRNKEGKLAQLSTPLVVRLLIWKPIQHFTLQFKSI